MKLISNQLSPNLNTTDIIRGIFDFNKDADRIIEQYFCSKNYLLANTARTCLGVIADVVNPDKKKKIGLPAFICAVVATPFLARGYEIEWIDTDEDGLIDVTDFEKKSDKISLLVVPHIFGQEAPLKKIMNIARPKNIFVVEDGAHLIRQLEAGFRPLADVQILSFGREKVVSCVSGGALIWEDESPYAEKFSNVKLANSSPLSTLKNLSQPVIFSLALPWWNCGGKIIPFIFQKLKWLPLAVSPSEKKGQEDCPQCGLGNIQKKILSQQLKNYNHSTVHRQALSLHWVRSLKSVFPKAKIVHPTNAFRVIAKNLSPDEIKQAKSLKKFYLNEWDGVPISPKNTKLSAFGYKTKKCPNAEKFAKSYLTFPTNKRVKKRDINAFAKIY